MARTVMLKPAEVARALKTSVQEIRALVRAGKLSARKRVLRGKNKRPRLLIQESELERFLRAMDTTDLATELTAGRAEAPKRPVGMDEPTGDYV